MNLYQILGYSWSHYSNEKYKHRNLEWKNILIFGCSNTTYIAFPQKWQESFLLDTTQPFLNYFVPVHSSGLRRYLHPRPLCHNSFLYLNSIYSCDSVSSLCTASEHCTKPDQTMFRATLLLLIFSLTNSLRSPPNTFAYNNCKSPPPISLLKQADFSQLGLRSLTWIPFVVPAPSFAASAGDTALVALPTVIAFLTFIPFL